MRRLLSVILGIIAGFASAVAFVSFFGGEELEQQLQERVDNAMEAGRKASTEKRQELEAELAKMHAEA